MESLTQIPVSLDIAVLLVRVHVAPVSDDATAVAALLDQARAVARPTSPLRRSVRRGPRGRLFPPCGGEMSRDFRPYCGI